MKLIELMEAQPVITDHDVSMDWETTRVPLGDIVLDIKFQVPVKFTSSASDRDPLAEPTLRGFADRECEYRIVAVRDLQGQELPGSNLVGKSYYFDLENGEVDVVSLASAIRELMVDDATGNHPLDILVSEKNVNRLASKIKAAITKELATVAQDFHPVPDEPTPDWD